VGERGRGRATPIAPAFALVVAAHLLAALLIGGCAGSRGPTVHPGAAGSDLAALIAAADTAIAAGDAASARRALDRALAVAPESAAVHLARGRFFTAIRRYKDAKEALERASTLAPSSPEPYYLLGMAYLSGGEREPARSAFARAVALDPGHARAREGLAKLSEGRYEAAGIPADYARLGGRSTVTRGELAVILAVELGADPDRTTWRAGEVQRVNWPELDQAWGARWLRASFARHWVEVYPDGSLHLDDPLTRGQLALILTRIALPSSWGKGSNPEPKGARPDTVFVDLGPRHYLAHAASQAFRMGMPLRAGRFEPLAAVTGDEALRSVRGLARRVGAVPIVASEPGTG